ncbi:hypothetical protein MRB53_014236 [Persea americana]|uniref:Uncharacterized protein n=1 Tax=Persea americana TaxID=3435 RepID=A0ACC2KAD4_PERAE|nr:hypothetical protein MRB53_014236 [Persea americana]
MRKRRTARRIVQDENNKKMTCIKDQEEDEIGQLPDAILHHILSLIPLKCAAKEIAPLSLPRDSLTILKLTNCNFELPLVFRGFSSLRVVHLTRVEIIDCSLDRMLVYCPMLEDLALKSCSDFPSSEISATDLKNIKSCTLSGGCNWSAYVGSFLSKLAHVQILAIGQMMMHGFKVPGYENATGNLPITLSDVIELQLEVLNISTLSDIYDLFTNWNFPCLEKLMVKWSPDGCSWTGRVQPSGCVFHCLKMIQMNGLYGNVEQMQMVKFFLEKAVKLDTIVLHREMLGLLYKNMKEDDDIYWRMRFGPLMMVLFYGFHALEEQTCQCSVMRFMRTSALDGLVCIESGMI